MLTALALLGVVAVLFAAAAVATRGGGVLADAPPDRADPGLPDGPLRPDDVRGLRFDLALRGYRMAEVDRALERLAAELADRDRRLELLVAARSGETGSAPAAPAAAGEGAPAREATAEDLPLAEPPPPAGDNPVPAGNRAGR